MFRQKWFGIVIGAAAAGLAAVPVQAGSLTLGTSGWTASWDSSADPYLGLNVDGANNSTVFIEKALNYAKSADADGSFDPVTINFQQTRADALPFIAINDESVTNNSGSDWNGFRFALDGAAFDSVGSNVGNAGGFSIEPFTDGAFSLGNTVLDVSGGAVANHDVWFPGVKSGNLIVITPRNTNNEALGSFSLSETPTGGPTAPAVPLPPAFWSGLIGLGGLGLIFAGQKVRKRMR